MQSFLDTTQTVLKYGDWIPAVNIGSSLARTFLGAGQTIYGATTITKVQALNGVLNLVRGLPLYALGYMHLVGEDDNWKKAKWAIGLALAAAAYDIFADHNRQIETWLQPEGITARHIWRLSLGFTQTVGGAIHAFRAKCAMIAQIPAGRSLYNQNAHHFLTGLSNLSRGSLECIPGVGRLILWGYE